MCFGSLLKNDKRDIQSACFWGGFGILIAVRNLYG